MHRHNEDSALYSQNSRYVLGLYKEYCQNPALVSQEWQDFFKTFPHDVLEEEIPFLPARQNSVTSSHQSPPINQQNIIDSIRALMLVRAYRVRGHLLAKLDPLNLEQPKYHSELDPQTYGFKEDDYTRPIYMDGVLGLQYATLNEIMQKLKKTYCGSIGVEFMHIQDPEQKSWIQYQFEGRHIHYSKEEKLNIYEGIFRAEAFEKFLHVKFPGAKRFGLDGGETLMPALETLLKNAADNKLRELVIGMAHRGRLCVLTNFLMQPKRYIFAQFQGAPIHREEDYGSGDVKYHSGFSTNREIDGHSIHLSLTPNPSHLEAVNPVVLGKVRAKQNLLKDENHHHVLGLLIHGDAAFAGQGMVAETLELSGLKGYRTGGTIHIIINNQIGFTTSPPLSRSSPYSSEMAKIVHAPVFHVNADDPEAVMWAMQKVYEFQFRFKHDAVLDMICYRRHGHNEGDEPMFTQPKMYQAIMKQSSTANLYEQHLQKEGIYPHEIENIKKTVEEALSAEFEVSKKMIEDQQDKLRADWLAGSWNSIQSDDVVDIKKPVLTGVDPSHLKSLGQKLLHVSESFNIHPKLAKLWDQKRRSIECEEQIDWSTAESLAFATLLVQGHPVRLSGQDSARGTFSQRHAALIDQKNEDRFIPLNFLSDKQALFEVVDSPLAEASVLGFEYGYSTTNPDALVMWEAQFGDFANGAQVIIDQFIASGEEKWRRLSGLVMLLPHGLEGQGPEHSSARLERFLQLAAEENMFIINATTPANYFHALRRQILAPYRKPLIVMTPKSLLRHKKVVSTFQEMSINTHFMPVYPQQNDLYPQKKDRVIICSGKVYYDLMEECEKQQLENVAIIRLEQFYPFPEKELTQALEPYRHAKIIWCQEEPYNMGGWFFVDRRIEAVLGQINAVEKRPIYAGRPAAASPATGFSYRHQQEQYELIKRALFEI